MSKDKHNYLLECDKNWVISFENLNAAKRAKDEIAIQRWNDELDRIEKAITDYVKEL